jgi:hypothetical protein
MSRGKTMLTVGSDKLFAVADRAVNAYVRDMSRDPTHSEDFRSSRLK